MPKLSWYAKRLAKMSPEEVLVMRLGRAVCDRLPRRGPSAPKRLSLPPFDPALPAFLSRQFPQLRETICAHADELCADRHSFFGRFFALPSPIDWHRDPVSGVSWPKCAARRLNYRDQAAGDPKDVWELNRHNFLPTLGLAYFLSDEPRYARKARELIESWIEQNPPGLGINWTSPIEAAIRIVNWLLTLRLLSARALLPEAFEAKVSAAIAAQASEIARHLSLYSSANNHLIAELCGLAQAGAALGRTHWLNIASKELGRQVARQIHEDGVGAEQSPHYLAHTLDFYALALLAFEQVGQPYDPAIEARLEKGACFLAALLDAEGLPPAFGDSDSGVVLTLGEPTAPYLSTVHLVGGLLGAGSLFDESIARDWRLALLLGPSRFSQALANRPAAAYKKPLRAFPKGGLFILEASVAAAPLRLVFDAGPLGLAPLYGHGHADALSFVLYDSGLPLLVDPGTYAYFKHPAWRTYFRSTAAHNTVRVDGCEQSVLSGPFFAEAPAAAHVASFDDSHVEAWHTGYGRLPKPVTHRRRAALDAQGLLLDDYLWGNGRHAVELLFHFDSQVVVLRDELGFIVRGPRRDWRLTLDERLDAELYRGDETSFHGWQSRRLNHKEPAYCLLARFSGELPLHFRTRMTPLCASNDK